MGASMPAGALTATDANTGRHTAMANAWPHAERTAEEAERRGFRTDCKALTGGGP